MLTYGSAEARLDVKSNYRTTDLEENGALIGSINSAARGKRAEQY